MLLAFVSVEKINSRGSRPCKERMAWRKLHTFTVKGNRARKIDTNASGPSYQFSIQ